jgi:hypothetical protein
VLSVEAPSEKPGEEVEEDAGSVVARAAQRL